MSTNGKMPCEMVPRANLQLDYSHSGYCSHMMIARPNPTWDLVEDAEDLLRSWYPNIRPWSEPWPDANRELLIKRVEDKRYVFPSELEEGFYQKLTSGLLVWGCSPLMGLERDPLISIYGGSCHLPRVAMWMAAWGEVIFLSLTKSYIKIYECAKAL